MRLYFLLKVTKLHLKRIKKIWGPMPESELLLGPRWAPELGQGSKSVSALKLGPGVKQMMILEPKSACELGLGP